MRISLLSIPFLLLSSVTLWAQYDLDPPYQFKPVPADTFSTTQPDTLGTNSISIEGLPSLSIVTYYDGYTMASRCILKRRHDWIVFDPGPTGDNLELFPVALDVNGKNQKELVVRWTTEWNIGCYGGGGTTIDSGIVIWDLTHLEKIFDYNYYRYDYTYREEYEEETDSNGMVYEISTTTTYEETAETTYAVTVSRKKIEIAIILLDSSDSTQPEKRILYWTKNGFRSKDLSEE